MIEQLTSPGADEYQVAIIGGGPAGLAAAIVLGRCRRRAIVFDHARPRNYAAKSIHGYLGLQNIAPEELRRLGREQACCYGVEFCDLEVTEVRCLTTDSPTRYELIGANGQRFTARKILFATGLRDELPAIENIADFYGKSVHHCQYCDGWEHRDQHFVAFGQGSAAVGLAVALRTWSKRVTACTNGVAISKIDERRLVKNGIRCRSEKVVAMRGERGLISELIFDKGPPLACDCLFFNTEQFQCSRLPGSVGCECDNRHMICTGKKQGTGVAGVFLAGDADGDAQFAIVAAAEGTTAATAINRELQDEDENK